MQFYNIQKIKFQISSRISKSENLSDKINENSLSVPLKEAREKFEKSIYLSNLKNLMEIYLKPQTLLAWKEVLT